MIDILSEVAIQANQLIPNLSHGQVMLLLTLSFIAGFVILATRK